MTASGRYSEMGRKLERLTVLEKEHKEIGKIVRWAADLFSIDKDQYVKATKGKLADRLEFIISELISTVEYLELPKERVDYPVPILSEEEKKEKDQRTEELLTAWGSQDDGCCTSHDESEDA